MRSVLYGFFSDSPAEIAAAMASLRSPLAPADARSHGEVKSSSCLAAVSERMQSQLQVGGPLCPRVFGAPGSPERASRWGHVEVGELLHPLLASPIAEALGADRALVAELVAGRLHPVEMGEEMRYDLGNGVTVSTFAQLASLLPEPLKTAALIEVLAVPPPDDRPSVALEPRSFSSTPWIGPLNELWESVVASGGRLHRLIQLNSPEIVLLDQANRAQRNLHRLFSAMSDPTAVDRALTPFRGAASSVIEMGTPGAPFAPEGARKMDGLFFLASQGDAQLVVTTPSTLRVLDARGRDVDTIECVGAAPIAQVDHRLVFAAPLHPRPDQSELHYRMAVYDLSARRYLDRWPADLSPIFAFSRTIFDVSRGEEVSLGMNLGGVEDLDLWASTRDGRFLFESLVRDEFDDHPEEDVELCGALFDARTGVPQGAVFARDDASAPHIIVDPRIDFDPESDELFNWASAVAIAQRGDGTWRFLSPAEEGGFVVSDGRERLLTLHGRLRAAAFDAEARNLAVRVISKDGADEGEIAMIDLERREVVSRFPG